MHNQWIFRQEFELRCLVIEDDADTSGYICRGLWDAGHSAVVCHNAADGLNHLVTETWDVVILDRLLPGDCDGLSILSKLRFLGKQTPVLILSALNSIDERVRGLRSGADDYLSKPFAIPELLARVEALLRRVSPRLESARIQVADLVLDLRTTRVTRGPRSIVLQPREHRLLEYLMRNAGQVVTRTMLLEGVWDYNFDPQTNVIDVQISRLRNKIDKDFTPTLIQTVRGVGYMLAALPSVDCE
jgi:two-component system OmpR family response regulator